MKKKFCICFLLTLGLFIDYSLAQSNNQDCGFYLLYLKNMEDSTLATAIYKVNNNAMYYEEWRYKNYHVEYKQHINNIEVQSSTLFSNRKEKAHYIYSSSSVIAEDKPKYRGFIKKLNGTNKEFKISPLPITLKENIIRIYDTKYYNKDSSFYYGLILKVDYCSDSTICLDPYKDYFESPRIGLVIDDQLVAVSSNYIRYNPYQTKRVDKYFVFYFPNKTLEEVEKIKKVLFRQTLSIVK